MQDRIEEALLDICVANGFCLNEPYFSAIVSTKYLTPEKFLNMVFDADKTEGSDRAIYSRVIKESFVKHLGSNPNFWNRAYRLNRKLRLNLCKERVVILDFSRRERMFRNAKYNGRPAALKVHLGFC